MKLITWNCQGAFRKKIDSILLCHPDILVIQECEKLEKLFFNSDTNKPNDLLWFGDNTHKGLALFSFGNYRFQLLKEYNKDIKFVVPVLVTNGKYNFTLLAIWANNRDDADGQYVEQVWKAVNYYANLLRTSNIAILGDFNSNKIWDKYHRIGNHSEVVKFLINSQIFSAYHGYFNQKQGAEKHPTFYLQRNQNKPYHIDYCFLSDYLHSKIKKVEVGSYKKWIPLSDHMPLIVDVSL